MPTIGGIQISDDELRIMAGSGSRQRQGERPSTGELLSSSAQSAWGELRYGLPYALEKAAGTASAADDEYYQAWLADSARKAAAASPQGGPAGISDVWNGRAGIGDLITENLVYSLPQMGAMLAGGVGGGLAGGPAGALAGATAAGAPLFAGSNVQRAAEDGEFTQAEAARSLAFAPAQAGMDALVGRFLPGAGKVLGKAASTQAGGFVKRTAASMGKAAATEAVTETGQQALERAAAGLPLNNREAMHELVEAFGTAAFVGGAMGSAGGFRGGAAKAVQTAESPNEVETDTIGAAVDELLGITTSSVTPQGRFRADPAGGVVAPGELSTDFTRVDEPAARADTPWSVTLPDDALELGSMGLPGADRAQLGAAFGGTVDPLAPEPAPRQLTYNPAGTYTPEAGVSAIGQDTDQTLLPGQNDPVLRELRKQPTGDLLAVAERTDNKAIRAAVAQEIDRRAEGATEGRLFDIRKQKLAKGQSKRVKDIVQGAKNYDDLLEQVNGYVNGDKPRGGKAGTRLAQQLGLLDEEGKPTDLSREVAAGTQPSRAQRVAANDSAPAPADRTPEFQGEVDKLTALVSKQRAAKKNQTDRVADERISTDILTSARTPEDLDQKLYKAIADDPVTYSDPANPSRIERLAQARGLVNDKLEFTDKGRQVAAATALTETDLEGVAQNEGFTGARASQFQRGARDFQQGNKPRTFEGIDSLKEAEAYNAGRRWAETSLAPRTGTTADTERVIGRVKPAFQDSEAAPLRPEPRNERDFVQPERDTTELDLQRMRLAEAERTGVADADGGEAYFDRQRRRRQRAAMQSAQEDRLIQTITGRKRNRKANREETHEVVGAAIEEAFADGNINSTQRLKLLDQRRRRNYQAVYQELRKATGSNIKPQYALFQSLVNLENTRMADMLRGKDFDGALDVLASEASTQFETQLIASIRRTMGKLRKAGYETRFKVAKPGDKYPGTGRMPMGYAWITEDGAVEVVVNGPENEGTAGTNFQTLLHEMSHAATILGIEAGRQHPKSQFGKPYRELKAISRALEAHLKSRQRQGNLLPIEEYLLREDKLDYIVRSADEVVAWGLTNPEFQEYLSSIQLYEQRTLWQQFVDMVRSVLGIPRERLNALDRVLKASAEMINTDPSEITIDTSESRVAPMVDVNQINDRFQLTAQNLVQKSKQVDLRSTKGAIRRKALGWRSVLAIAESYPWIKGLKGYAEAQLERQAMQNHFGQLASTVMRPFHRLERENKKAAERIEALMEFTRLDIDPRKSWAEHDHLHGEKDAGFLKGEVRKANNWYRDLQQKGHAKIYDSLIALNEMMHYASASVALHNLAKTDPELMGKIGPAGDPAAAFREARETQEDPVAARDFWRQQLDRQMQDADKFIEELRGEDVETKTRAKRHLSLVEAQVRMIRSQMNQNSKSPYFHLGRSGDYFVAFTLRQRNGQTDPAAARKAAKAMADAGIEGVRISADNSNPKVYISAENIAARDRAFAVAKQLEKDGLVDPEGKPIRDKREAAGSAAFFGNSPDQLNRFIESVESDPAFDVSGMKKNDPQRQHLEKIRDGIISHARELWINQMPDTSLSKVFAERKGVQGYSTNMARNFAHRYQLSSNAVAGMSSSAQISQAISGMRDQLHQAQGDPKADIDLHRDLLEEVLLREFNHTERDQEIDGFDKLRAGSHAYFLGMSPSYALVNMTQMGVLLWPELAKKGGFVRAAKSISKVTPDALKILRATFAEARKEGWRHWGDISITPEIMAKAGVDKGTADFVLQMAASGVIDLGSAARELGQLADQTSEGAFNTTTRLASSLGLYSETMTRLVAALAARDVHNGKAEDLLPYAKSVVNESMFNYSQAVTARMMGKKGLAGPITPVITQFMQYSAQLLDKMYREIHAALPSNMDAQRKKEARRFLGAHLTAVMALAGTLGSPFATVAATAIEGLVDLFDDDDEPYDATAALRNFYTSVFGETLGEVAARGLPRAVGFDISSRVGEQDIIPGSQFLSDRREWKEALEAFIAGRATGAAGGMVEGIVDGMGKIAEGDLMGGMAAGAPLALRGPAKAYTMSRDGYTDSRGNKLPITPDAEAYLWQVLGLNPAEKAEYSEARGDQAARRSTLSQRATKLRNGIAEAIMAGDAETARELLAEASKFDRDVPEFAVIPDIENAIKRRMRVQALSKATGAPVGVGLDDTAARQLTGYANFN